VAQNCLTLVSDLQSGPEHERLSALPQQSRLLYRGCMLEGVSDVYRCLYTPPWARRRLQE
jgi:hypothetical protein